MSHYFRFSCSCIACYSLFNFIDNKRQWTLPGVTLESVWKDEALIMVEYRSEDMNLCSVTCTWSFRVPLLAFDFFLFYGNDSVFVRPKEKPTWCFRLPLGILFVCPWEFHTSQNRSIKNSAAEYTSKDISWMPLPLVYCGRNHWRKSWSNLLPLKACAMILISSGDAHRGTFL